MLDRPEPMRESQLVDAIIRHMHYLPDFFVWRANAGSVPFRRKDGSPGYMKGNVSGCPDVIGIGPGGRFVGIEAKVGKNTQRDTQKRFQESCDSRGGYYAIIRSPEDLLHFIKTMRRSVLGQEAVL